MKIERINEKTYKLETDQYLQKIKDKYRIIYPIKKDLSKPFKKGNIRWKNLILGDVSTTMVTMIIIFSLLIVSFSYKDTVEKCNDLAENVCDYCTKLSSEQNNSFLNIAEVVFNEKEINFITGNIT